MTIVCVLLWGIVALAGFVICPKCGYENDDSRATCKHCGAAVTAGKREAEAIPLSGEKAVASEEDAVQVEAQAVVDEVHMGKQAITDGDVELARLFFRNAAALDLLSASSPGEGRSEAIATLISQCDASAQVRRRCPECDGSGKRIMSVDTLKGETVYREAPGMTCGGCGGRGFVSKRGTVDDRMYAMGRAVRRYKTMQLGRKYVAVGSAWAPPDVAEALTVEQSGVLRRATAAPCSTCVGIGRTNCKTCKGQGSVECPNGECEQGMAPVEKDSYFGGKSLLRMEKCKACSGKGYVACATCRGLGSVVCRECKGTGERPDCRKCGGEGVVNCRRCDGTGSYKGAACPACGAEGKMLCTSCNGDGCK